MNSNLKSMENYTFVWAAIDTSNWEIIGVWVTKGCASIEAYSFLKTCPEEMCESTKDFG